MKRISYDHAEDNIVKALGFDSPEDITAATEDENHPDHLKLRLAAAILNADANLVVAVWVHLLTGQELTSIMTKNLEVLFQHYDDPMLKGLDEAIGLYSRNKTTLTEEDLEAVKYVEEALEARDA